MNTLAAFFDWLLTASFRASMITLIVLGIQLLFGRQLGARARYALWIPVLIVMLTPMLPQSRWSIENLLVKAPQPLAIPHAAPAARIDVPVPSVEMAAARPQPIDWPQIGLFTWMSISAALLLFGTFAFFRTLRRFERARCVLSDESNALIQQTAREAGLKHTPPVWCSSAITSPAVTGLWRPVLLLPADFEQTFTTHEAHFILLHEFMHVKRHDLPLNALLSLLMTLHWFNPLLWLALHKVRLDRETACDAQVLENALPQRRAEYGHALLKAEAAFAPLQFSLGFVGLFHSGAALRTRIECIARHQPSRPAMKLITLTIIGLLTFLGITRAAAPPADPKSRQILIDAKFLEFTKGSNQWLLPFESAAAAGVFTEQQFKTLLEKVAASPGVDVLTTPRVATRDGQHAKVEISREFIYKLPDGKPATKQLGTSVELLAKVGNNGEIDLTTTPQIVQLDGMVTDAKSGVEQPVFTERKTTSSMSVLSGQTIILGLPPVSTVQTVKENQGGSETVKNKKISRQILVFITARLADAGQTAQTMQAGTAGTATEQGADVARRPDAGKPESPALDLEEKLQKIIIPHVVFREATVFEALDYFRLKSRQLDPSGAEGLSNGVNILLRGGGKNTARLTLELKQVPLGEALKYAAGLAGMEMHVEASSVVMSPKGSAAPAAVETKAKQGAEPSILIPSLVLTDAALDEALQFIRIKSRELDPAKNGVKILQKPGATSDAKISIQLRNVPVEEALRYITTLAGLHLSREGKTFIIAPAN